MSTNSPAVANPALFTSRSIGRSGGRDALGDLGAAGGGREVGDEHVDAHRLRAQPVGDLLEADRVAGDEHEVVARGREVLGVRGPDAGAAPGDQRDAGGARAPGPAPAPQRLGQGAAPQPGGDPHRRERHEPGDAHQGPRADTGNAERPAGGVVGERGGGDGVRVGRGDVQRHRAGEAPPLLLDVRRRRAHRGQGEAVAGERVRQRLGQHPDVGLRGAVQPRGPGHRQVARRAGDGDRPAGTGVATGDHPGQRGPQERQHGAGAAVERGPDLGDVGLGQRAGARRGGADDEQVDRAGAGEEPAHDEVEVELVGEVTGQDLGAGSGQPGQLAGERLEGVALPAREHELVARGVQAADEGAPQVRVRTGHEGAARGRSAHRPEDELLRAPGPNSSSSMS